MANWHALTGTPDGNSYAIAYHLPIPNTNNRVGINYRTALVNSGLGGKTVLPDGDGTGGTISTAEKADITSGAVFEVVEAFATNPGQTLGQLAAAVDARHAALANVNGPTIQGLASRLSYYGGVSS